MVTRMRDWTRRQHVVYWTVLIVIAAALGLTIAMVIGLIGRVAVSEQQLAAGEQRSAMRGELLEGLAGDVDRLREFGLEDLAADVERLRELEREAPPEIDVDDLRGPRGLRGPAGPPGPAGTRGEQGEPGGDGPAGTDGDPGTEGPPGQQGEPGTEGPQGETGPAGPAGPAGPQGARGEPGPTGPTGPAGPTGSQGEPGRPPTIDEILAALDAWFADNHLTCTRQQGPGQTFICRAG